MDLKMAHAYAPQAMFSQPYSVATLKLYWKCTVLAPTTELPVGFRKGGPGEAATWC